MYFIIYYYDYYLSFIRLVCTKRIQGPKNPSEINNLQKKQITKTNI